MKIASSFQQEYQKTPENVKTLGIGEIWALVAVSDNHIITGSINGNLRLYNVNLSGKRSEMKSKIDNAHGEQVSITCLTALDSKYFLSGGEDGSIKRWEIDGDQLKNPIEIKYHTGKVTRIILLKDNNLVASCSYDKTIKIWGKNSPFSISYNSTYIKEWNKVHSIVQLKDPNFLVDSWGSTNGFISLWDLSKLKRVGTITDVFTSCPYGLIELPDEKIAVSHHEPPEIIIIDPKKLEVFKKITDKVIIGQSSLLNLPNGGFLYASEGNYLHITASYELKEKSSDKKEKNLCGNTGLFVVGKKYILTNNDSFGFGVFTF